MPAAIAASVMRCAIGSEMVNVKFVIRGTGSQSMIKLIHSSGEHGCMESIVVWPVISIKFTFLLQGWVEYVHKGMLLVDCCTAA